MLKFVVIIALNWIVLILTIPMLLIYLLLKVLLLKKWSDSYLIAVCNLWGHIVLGSTGSRVQIVGRENIPDDTAFCLMANHQSSLDIPLIIGFIPRVIGFIAKQELKLMPIINAWMQAMHCVFIDRKNARQSLKRLETALERIHRGDSLVIFPEGTRSKSAEMNPFKTGNIRMVIRAGVPILPVTIDGTYRILHESNRIHASHVRLVIHPLIQTSALSAEASEALPRQLQTMIASELTI